jgi:hypothetical protein
VPTASTAIAHQLERRCRTKLDRGGRGRGRCRCRRYERTTFAPIWQLAFINGVGPQVAESAFGKIARFPYTAPYEDISLKAM